ncbi:MAG: hypothetical protein AAFR83_15640 [Cyanobacteria bacterium J06629_18]
MTIVAQKTIAKKVEAPEKFADKLGKHFDDHHRVFLATIVGEALGIDLKAGDIIGAFAEGEQFHIFWWQWNEERQELEMIGFWFDREWIRATAKKLRKRLAIQAPFEKFMARLVNGELIEWDIAKSIQAEIVSILRTPGWTL